MSPLLKKYLVSYALLVMIPVTVLSGIILFYFYHTYESETRSLAGEVARQQQVSFESELENLDKIAISIGGNAYLTSGYFHSQVSNLMVSEQFLQNYSSSNFIYDMHLMYFDDSIVITAHGVWGDQYYQQVYGSRYLKKTEIQKTLVERGAPYLLKLTDLGTAYQYAGYVYIAPIPFGMPAPIGAVVFFIPNTKVQEFIANIGTAVDGYGFAVDGQGNMLATTLADHTLQQTALQALPAPGETATLQYGGTSYTLQRTALGTAEISFCTLRTNRQWDPKFLLVLRIVLLCCLVFLGGASAVLYHLVDAYYKPLQLLQSQLSAKKAEDAKSVRAIVQTISEELGSLKTASLDNRWNSMLIQLLSGSIANMEDFEAEYRSRGIWLEDKSFAAVTFLFSQLEPADKKRLCGELYQFEEIDCYPVDVWKKNSLTYLFASAKELDPLLPDILRILHTRLKEEAGCVVTVGAGNCVSDLKELSQSYLNSLTCLEARFVKGLDTLIFFREIEQQTANSFQYPYVLVEQFQNALLSHNTELIASSIDNIFSKIKKSDMALVTTRTFCCNIVQMAFRSFPGARQSRDAWDTLHNIDRLMQAETVDELSQSLKDICKEYLEGKAVGGPERGHIQTVLHYVEENCFDPDFSLQMVADHFHMSSSYVSRYFSAQNNGVTMLEYVTKLRMEKAKNLLQKKDLSIPLVAKEVGYLNLSSFTRKFKQMNGVPPAAYRQQSRGKETL